VGGMPVCRSGKDKQGAVRNRGRPCNDVMQCWEVVGKTIRQHPLPLNTGLTVSPWAPRCTSLHVRTMVVGPSSSSMAGITPSG
jgi:hypothetical protein